MPQISLTKGAVTLVDTADFHRLNQMKWCLNNKGYAVHYTYRDDKRVVIYIHRFILNVHSPDLQVDHINHNRLDNRRANLRLATRSQNQANQGRQINNQSGFQGVNWNNGKWEARIRYQNRRFFLGRYDDLIFAAGIRDVVALYLFGEFAVLNCPDRSASPAVLAAAQHQLTRHGLLG